MKLTEEEIIEKCREKGIRIINNPNVRSFYDDESKILSYRNLKTLIHEYEHVINNADNFKDFISDLKYQILIHNWKFSIGWWLIVIVMYYLYVNCSVVACNWLPNPIFI